MITKNMIRKGLKQCVIKIVEGDMRYGTQGTVCMIEDNQFYFSEHTEDISPEDYLANVPLGDIVEEIYDTLEEMKTEFSDEYEFYAMVLSELEENNKGE